MKIFCELFVDLLCTMIDCFVEILSERSRVSSPYLDESVEDLTQKSD